MGYREVYIENVGKMINMENEIHHINHNRKDNSIYNLVELPKKLHREYHLKHLKYSNAVENINTFNWIYDFHKEVYLKDILEYIEIKNKISHYIIKRNDLIHSK